MVSSFVLPNVIYSFTNKTQRHVVYFYFLSINNISIKDNLRICHNNKVDYQFDRPIITIDLMDCLIYIVMRS